MNDRASLYRNAGKSRSPLHRILPVLCLVLPAFADQPVNVTMLSFTINLNQFHAPSSIEGFTGACKSELNRCAGVRVLERENLSDITSEIALGSSGLLKDPAAAVDSLRFEGVDYVIGGEISQSSTRRYHVDVFIREVRTARIVSEKISGNIERHPEAAAQMLAHNIACLLTGSGAPIEKKVLRGSGGLTTALIGLGGLVAGAGLRYLGEKEYTERYSGQDLPLTEFDHRFNRAQDLTWGGEALIGASSATLVTGIIITFSGRRERTLTRE
jgi:hypothetical protein